jgi:diadenylate cyclase
MKKAPGVDSPTRHKAAQAEGDLAQMIAQMAQVVQADVILCGTETGALPQHLHRLSNQPPIIAATTNEETYDALGQMGLEIIRLPVRVADRYKQVQYMISIALKTARIASGDLVICAVGHNLYPGEGILIVLTEVEPSIEKLAVSDLIKLTDGIRPTALEAAVTIACKIGRAARRGKRIGTTFILGDSLRVLDGSRQLVPNPFHGHDGALRRLTNPEIHEALIELSKLDGAFVVRGDGFIQAAGVFLASAETEIELPTGLGARHVAAAAVTRRTAATAIAISATDGNVRIFSEGKLVLQIDPSVAHGPISLDK